jgi:hypothetical protein
VTPINLKHLAGTQHKVLSGQTPPADECIKLLQMVLKRYHPDDYEEIDKAMQEANLAASTYVRFIKMQGEFSQWIGRVMGNEISSFIPRIYRLSRLQDEVNEEENALLEEMSIGRSVASLQASECEPEHPLAEDNTVLEETGTEQVSRMEQAEEDFTKDLHPLDPILHLLSVLRKKARRSSSRLSYFWTNLCLMALRYFRTIKKTFLQHLQLLRLIIHMRLLNMTIMGWPKQKPSKSSLKRSYALIWTITSQR